MVSPSREGGPASPLVRPPSAAPLPRPGSPEWALEAILEPVPSWPVDLYDREAPGEWEELMVERLLRFGPPKDEAQPQEIGG